MGSRGAWSKQGEVWSSLNLIATITMAHHCWDPRSTGKVRSLCLLVPANGDMSKLHGPLFAAVQQHRRSPRWVLISPSGGYNLPKGRSYGREGSSGLPLRKGRLNSMVLRMRNMPATNESESWILISAFLFSKKGIFGMPVISIFVLFMHFILGKWRFLIVIFVKFHYKITIKKKKQKI